jgi:hypothetical protein
MSSIGRFGGGYVEVVKMNACSCFPKSHKLVQNRTQGDDRYFDKKLKNNTLFIWHKNWPIS